MGAKGGVNCGDMADYNAVRTVREPGNMSAENVQKMVLISPVNEANLAESTYAPRVTALDGKRVGLLDNSKNKADKLLDAVTDILDTQYGFTDVVRRRKPSASKPVAPEVIAELGEQCDLVIVGVGD